MIHSRDDDQGFGSLNGCNYGDAEVDKLLQSTADIVDPTERKTVLEQLNKLAMDKVAVIPLHYQQDLYAIQKDKGIQFTPRPDRWMVYKEMGKE